MKRGRPSIFTIMVSLIAAMSIGATALADGELLKRGLKSDEVKQVQTRLMDLGYYQYNEATGYFGVITEDAVKKFQSEKGLKVDGIVGPQTWNLLFASDASATPLPQPTGGAAGSEISLSRNMEGPEVVKIQTRLQELGLYGYDRITGYFGSITETAVKSFQKAHGLKDDGIVGPRTYEALFSKYQQTSLIPGMVNSDVTELQERLSALGYYTYHIDGAYGTKTKEAVMYFQRAHGLTEDGIAGSVTKQVLFSNAALTEQEARRMLTTASGSVQTADGTNTAAGTAQQLIEYARQYLGKPYVYAASGPDLFDCTGYTCYVFKNFGINLPRSAYDQGYSDYGIKITDPSQLQPGDLVFFNTVDDGDLSDHSGIYLGNGQFIHANSTSMKVIITDMNTSQYYTARFSWARRVLN